MTVPVDAERVTQELEVLAQFSDAPAPAVTRIVFSSSDMRARAWLKSLFVAAGLRLREDAVGNVFARWEGSAPQAPAVATGSHIDAIPNSGGYDGTVGVLGGLEAIRALQRSAFQPRRSIELIVFTSEEPTRFAIGCLGSRLLSGTLSPEKAAPLKDREGKTLDEIRQQAGFSGALDEVRLPAGAYRSFIELHIEQGPVLEQTSIGIGVVTDIAAPASLRVTIRGEGGHAGAVLMPDRRDALLGAAEIALAVESAALTTGVRDSVATTGVCDVYPGAVNSIPSQVKLEIDVRDTDLARRETMVRMIATACSDVAAKRGLEITCEVLNADAPAQCDPLAVDAIIRACEAVRSRYSRLVSRAYHDALFMSRVAPTGMIFIPCRRGVSHRPDEYASPEDISRGVSVLAHTLADLSNQ
ncbi:MAG: M20 family metallo-hydrolase [Acidobacteriaceae bacterium]|nr:M20 family metallo-hydrolase [Acidobacteriaceae bacterium]